MHQIVLVLAVCTLAAGSRTVYSLDNNWKFELGSQACSAFTPSNGTQCRGLEQASGVSSLQECQAKCCASSLCEIYQWCPSTCHGSPSPSCWIGSSNDCYAQPDWVGGKRNTSITIGSAAVPCNSTGCDPNTNDSTWRVLNVPHDFVIEGNFSPSADIKHGYLPYGTAWYRKHITFPETARGAVIWIDFEAIQTTSMVYFNNQLLGTKGFGYTNSRYFLNESQINWNGADNLLAVYVDATVPDSWWYDGGGIYRHVWLTVINTPGPYIAPWGVYAPSNVTGAITWSAAGAPSGPAVVMPSVEVWTNVSTPSQPFSITLTVKDGAGNVVGTSTGSGVVSPGVPTLWTSPVITLSTASLWHVYPVGSSLLPALYTLSTTVSVGGTVVDADDVIFGIRRTYFDAATGFYLNDVPFKINGTANHQDAPAVGVAVPDHLQAWRVSKLKEMGVSGWRTAHNPPNPALMDAADTVGMVVWDETHRNGFLSELELLIRRDRNHPSVVIWSLCNEKLCRTPNATADIVHALQAKELIRQLDPLGQRPTSANNNGWIGPNTPLDLQGFDYTTQNYDAWHAGAPNIPSISSETASSTSDRGEYANNATSAHETAYDTQAYGERPESAWGGVNITNGQGIWTRPFISGGWTWTGHDYRGEPTPYQWPSVNSHFGIVDAAGFPKDRFYYYKAWNMPTVPTLHLFPHWNWAAGDLVSVWVYANVDSVELFVNGRSLGVKTMPIYDHVEWDNVTFAPGGIQAVGYKNGIPDPVAVEWRNTTGRAAALQISIKDGVGASMVAGCWDVALVQVEVVDSNGAVVPDASDVVTFAVSGPATIAGTANGDPSCLVNNQSPSRPAFHGLMLGVLLGGDEAGVVKVTASAPGLGSVSLPLTVDPQPQGFNKYWCNTRPTL